MATRKAYQKCKSAVVLLFILLLPIVAFAALSDSGDGTIFDDTNNLTWAKSTQGKMNWTEATAAAAASTLAGYTDWRLPTLAELRTLVNSDYWPQIDPIFYMGGPGNIGDWTHWTSSTIEDDDFVLYDRAYIVFFDDGTDRSVPKNNHFNSRMVRTILTNLMYWESTDVVQWDTGGDYVVWH